MRETIFMKSLKRIKSDVLLMMLVDSLPYILGFVGVLLIFKLLTDQASSIYVPENLISLSVEEAELFLAKIRVFYYSIIGYSLLLFVLLLAAWSFSKGYIYSKVLNKKFTLRYFFRFFLLNILWIIPWILLFFVLTKTLKQNIMVYVFLIAVFLWIHFSVILYVLYTKQNKLNKMMDALKLGIKKLHQFILPYILIVVLFGLFFLLSYVFNFLPQVIGIILTITAFLFFAAVSRIYLINIIKSKKEV